MANLGAQSNDDQVSLFLNKYSSLMWRAVNDKVWHGYDKDGELQSVVVTKEDGADQFLFGCLVRGDVATPWIPHSRDIFTSWIPLAGLARFLENKFPKETE